MQWLPSWRGASGAGDAINLSEGTGVPLELALKLLSGSETMEGLSLPFTLSKDGVKIREPYKVVVLPSLRSFLDPSVVHGTLITTSRKLDAATWIIFPTYVFSWNSSIFVDLGELRVAPGTVFWKRTNHYNNWEKQSTNQLPMWCTNMIMIT